MKLNTLIIRISLFSPDIVEMLDVVDMLVTLDVLNVVVDVARVLDILY